MKYVCDVCGWEYDEEKGYPEGGIAPVRYVLQAKTSFQRLNKNESRTNGCMK